MAAYGMLGSLFNPNERDLRAEQQDEENNLQGLARMGGFAADRYAAYAGGRQLGRGIGEIAGAAAGVDTRSPNQTYSAAIEAAKAQVAKLGLDPNDPKSIDEFYKQVMVILQKQGLAAAALEVGKEYRDQKRKDQTADLALKAETRKQGTADANAAAAKERNRIAAEKLGSSAPEVVKLLDMLDAMAADGVVRDPNREAALIARVNALSAPKGLKVVPAGDHYDLLDASGVKIGEGDVNAKPMSEKDQAKQDQQDALAQTKYEQTKNSLQTNYSAAAELYNHPGLKDAVGVVAGLISKGQINQQSGGWLDVVNRYRLSDAARSAVAKIAQVQGQTFIGALIDLKASSSTGASGLGSLTEVEGAKIQNAKAALDPQQPYPSYRANLAQYMKQIEVSSQLIDDGAQRLGLKTKALNTTATGSTATPAASAAPATPKVAPVAPVAPAAPTDEPKGGPERWERVNGKIQLVK